MKEPKGGGAYDPLTGKAWGRAGQLARMCGGKARKYWRNHMRFLPLIAGYYAVVDYNERHRRLGHAIKLAVWCMVDYWAACFTDFLRWATRHPLGPRTLRKRGR